MKIGKLKENRREYNGREIKLFFPSDADDDMTLLEFNKEFGIPAWIYCDTLESINLYRPLITNYEKLQQFIDNNKNNNKNK